MPARRFGGIGLMVESPGIVLRFRPANTWLAQGPLAERALAFARSFVACMGMVDHVLSGKLKELMSPPQEIIVERGTREHIGLGTGTQLGLAVARGLSEVWKLPVEAQDMYLAARGKGRSALGFHGFFQGGFLVEAGQKNQSMISPLVARLPFPQAWRIVLIIPPGETGVHGSEEREAFQQLLTEGIPLQQIEHLCQLTLLGLLPALVERDFKSFGEALFDYNSLAGRTFAKFQGGTYASPRIAELIQFIRQQGNAGVGQSSWGPTVFAVVEDESRGQELARQNRDAFGLQEHEVIVTQACNQGASISKS
jgi:beta-RFAP synthase